MLNLPNRHGDRPLTTPSNPHEQRTQNPSAAIYAAFKSRAFDFECIDRTQSLISVPGAEALWMRTSCRHGPAEAFMVGNEFAHIHPEYDGSLHLALPNDLARHVIDKGWGEPHPMAARGIIPTTIIMVYAPRDWHEVDFVLGILAASHEFARGSQRGSR